MTDELGEFESKSQMRRIMEIDDKIICLEHTTRFFREMHSYAKCEGQPCTIHNRSNHSMREFPQYWRGDVGLMERTCPHGIGHPDPDEINLDKNGRGSHGCDGCCQGAYSEKEN